MYVVGFALILVNGLRFDFVLVCRMTIQFFRIRFPILFWINLGCGVNFGKKFENMVFPIADCSVS